MADKITIAFGIKPYDGEYDFDLEEKPFTILEWRWIKKISGYMPATVSDGAEAGDPDLFLAFAVVALVRAGKVQADYALMVADKLSSTPFDGTSITFAGDEDEDADALPPAPASATTLPTDSGTPGKPTLVPPGNQPAPTGVPVSGMSSDAVPGTLTA